METLKRTLLCDIDGSTKEKEADGMKKKIVIKIAIDIAMTAVLILLMAYELIGRAAHEWVGVAMFVLFILHHILNNHWCVNLFKGKYTAARILQTILVILVLLCMLGSMLSGIILSRHVFSFVSIRGWRSLARNLHMISAYWGFVFMSLHLGFHWNMMTGMAGKLVKKTSALRKWVLRAIAVLIAGYGVYAFIHRGIGRYMLMRERFVFFNFEEKLIFFIADYIAIMGLFVFVGHYLSAFIRNRKKAH